jgi:hypothetical protein
VRLKLKAIPILAARRVAEQYGYDQVVIIARKVGDSGGEHVTTYGVDKPNCDAAARIGNFLKHKVMGWPGMVEKVIEFKMGEPERHYRVTLRKAGDHSVQLVSTHPGMLTGVNVHTEEWRAALSRALFLEDHGI